MSDLRRDFEGNGKDWTPPSVVCDRCKGSGVIRVLGGGGDYENWPCPTCRPATYQEAVADQSHPGASAYDGSAD